MALENPANSVEDSPHVSKGFSGPCVTHVEKSPFLETKPNSPTRARAYSSVESTSSFTRSRKSKSFNWPPQTPWPRRLQETKSK